ncbi:MAG TPA: hypothetical protein VE988_08300 [Gemmataceae bacterium]|nr:hypothetical protein [Gemmataceae bacterium]
MTVEQFRNLRDAVPFRPFTIHLAGGRALYVPHRDFVSQSPGGRTIIVYQSAEAFSIVDLFLVNELVVQPIGSDDNPGGNNGPTKPVGQN